MEVWRTIPAKIYNQRLNFTALLTFYTLLLDFTSLGNVFHLSFCFLSSTFVLTFLAVHFQLASSKLQSNHSTRRRDSLRSKRSRTSRMKSDRAKELFRIRAARKQGLEQFGRANAKKLFRAVRFHSARTGTLATQANAVDST